MKKWLALVVVVGGVGPSAFVAQGYKNGYEPFMPGRPFFGPNFGLAVSAIKSLTIRGLLRDTHSLSALSGGPCPDFILCHG